MLYTGTMEDEVLVVHSLRQAQAIFKLGSPSTVQAWIKDGRLDGTFENKAWTIRIPPDHPDLPRNKVADPPIHYPMAAAVVDERDAKIATLEAQVELLTSERDHLREQQQEWQRVLPELAVRLVEQMRPPALPAPEPKPRRWWHWLY